MSFDWILNPLTPFVMIALALAACLACFLATKSEVYRLRRAAADTQRVLARKLEQVELAVASIHEQPAEEPPLAPIPTVRPSLNLTRRTQALRMRRRGESAESIAAALAAPRNEIELLIKVYEMVEVRKGIAAPAEPAG